MSVAGRSHPLAQAQPEGASVRVIDQTVERVGPRAGERPPCSFGQWTQPPWWARADAAPLVPALQGAGGGREGGERGAQLDVLVAGAEVLARQTCPKVAGIDGVAEVADSSKSWVQERRLKLSDPTDAQVSSTTQTLAWT